MSGYLPLVRYTPWASQAAAGSLPERPAEPVAAPGVEVVEAVVRQLSVDTAAGRAMVVEMAASTVEEDLHSTAGSAEQSSLFGFSCSTCRSPDNDHPHHHRCCRQPVGCLSLVARTPCVNNTATSSSSARGHINNNNNINLDIIQQPATYPPTTYQSTTATDRGGDGGHTETPLPRSPRSRTVHCENKALVGAHSTTFTYIRYKIINERCSDKSSHWQTRYTVLLYKCLDIQVFLQVLIALASTVQCSTRVLQLQLQHWYMYMTHARVHKLIQRV